MHNEDGTAPPTPGEGWSPEGKEEPSPREEDTPAEEGTTNDAVKNQQEEEGCDYSKERLEKAQDSIEKLPEEHTTHDVLIEHDETGYYIEIT